MAYFRNKTKLLLHTVRIDINRILNTLDGIDTFEDKPKVSNTGFKTYAEFMAKYTIDTIEIVDASHHNTLCQNCNTACHDNCSPDEMTVIGDQIFPQCWMIKKGKCRQCIGKCSSASHYHAKKTIKNNKKKIQDILNDIITKYNQIAKGNVTSQQKITSKEDAREQLENALQQKTEETKQLCIDLLEIYASSNVTKELLLFVDQLKKECATCKSVNTQNQGNALIHSLKGFINQIAVEPSLTMNILMDNSASETENSNENELKELLIDELIKNQQAVNLSQSLGVEESSINLVAIQEKIQLLLHTTCVDINRMQKTLDEIDTFEDKLKVSKTDFKTYEEFVANHVIDTIDILDVPYNNTLCQNCNAVCHENCDPKETTLIGEQIVQQCLVISNGNCRRCIGKCSSTLHYHAKKTIEKGKKKIQDILNDIITKNDQETIDSKEDTKKIIERALKEKTDVMKQICITVHHICPDCDLIEKLQVLIDQLVTESAGLSGTNAKGQASAMICDLKELYATILHDRKVSRKKLLQTTVEYTESEDENDQNIESDEDIEETQKRQQSTITAADKSSRMFAPEWINHENDPDSIKSSEMGDETIQMKQEIIDTSAMTKILIIGETGSGKSTFINYLTNYFHNGSLENLHVAIPTRFHPNVTEKFSHCENDIQNTTQSKTDKCNQYMFSTNSKQYLFIDTPGLSDTRGAQQDDKNVAKILDSVESLGGLTAVIMVVNGAVSRLTINLQNVLTRLRGNLPDSIMGNVIIVLTNVTRYAVNFSLPALKLNGNVYPYYMQNSAFSQDPTNWTPKVLEAIQHEFDQSMDEINNMIQTIDGFQTKSVTAFKTMKDIRNEIKTLLHMARLEVSQIQKLQDEIDIYDSFVKQCDTHLVTYKDYTQEREIDVTEIVDAPFHSTLCRQCNQICHENCQLDESITTGAQIFYQCWAIDDGFCKVCIGKCSYINHYHAKKTIKTSKKKVQDMLKDIKTKYDQTTKEKNTHEQNITSKGDARKMLEGALKHKDEEIKQLCTKLRNICTGFDLPGELRVLIDQLETEETMLRSIEAKQQANVLIRNLKDLCNRMANDLDSIAQGPSEMKIMNTAPSSDNPSRRGLSNSTKTHASNDESSMSQETTTVDVPESPSETSAYANDDILAVIRAINEKRMAKKTNSKKSKDKIESEENVDTADNNGLILKQNDDDDESESDDESEESSVTQDDDSEESSVTEDDDHMPSSAATEIEDPKSLSIKELIVYYNSHKDHPQANLIIFELVQRSLGRSVGPMKTSKATEEFAASTQNYSRLGPRELMEEYGKLKNCIDVIIASDIFKLNQVPSKILSDIAAVNMLLQRSSSVENPLFNINQQPNYSLQNTTLGYPAHHPIPSPFQHDPRYNPYVDPQNQHQVPYNMSTANTQFYPQYYQYNNYSPIPNTVDDGSAADQNQPYVDPESAIHPIEQPSADSSLSTANTLQNIDQPAILNNPLEEHSSSSNHQSPTLNTISSHPSNPDDLPIDVTATGVQSNSIAEMPTIELISNYKDACTQNNPELSDLYCNKLKRRCYGAYPTLISEKQELFDETCQTYTSQTLEDLKQKILQINQTIDTHLVDGDPTHINDIPDELIIEAAAINHLITVKSSDTESIN